MLEYIVIGIVALAVGLGIGWIARYKLGLQGSWASAALGLGAMLVYFVAKAVIS